LKEPRGVEELEEEECIFFHCLATFPFQVLLLGEVPPMFGAVEEREAWVRLK
jgi:hypothetical protein